MFIDIHAHAYLFPSPPQDGRNTIFCNPEQLLAIYDRTGVEKGFLLPLVSPETYLPQSNEEILEICHRYPGRFIPCCNLDPRGIGNSPETDFSVWLKWYKDHGFRAVGEFMPNLPFTDPLVLNFFKQVEAFEFPLIFDISDRIGGRYGLYDDAGLPQLEYCLKSFPKLKIFGHGPAFWSEISRLDQLADRGGYPTGKIKEEGALQRLFRKYPNMYGDLSATSGGNAFFRDEEHGVGFLNEFQDRLCFGGDICCAAGKAPMIDFLLKYRNNGIDEAVFQKIARENAIRIFQLEE